MSERWSRQYAHCLHEGLIEAGWTQVLFDQDLHSRAWRLAALVRRNLGNKACDELKESFYKVYFV